MSHTFSIIAPASFTKPEIISEASLALAQLGIDTKIPETLQKPERYLAGSIEHRINTIKAAYADPETDAVWAVRGGYGCAQIAGLIDWKALPNADKPLIGYSDITVLLNERYKLGLPAIHGPVMKEGVKLISDDHALQQASNYDFQKLLDILDQKDQNQIPLTAHSTAAEFTATGPLVGGNLAVLASIAGTPLQFTAPKNAIVILEDVGEPYYRLERDMRQLVESGALNQAQAVCLGTFEGCTPYYDLTLEALFCDCLAALNLPLFTGLPIGHGKVNYPWRYGVNATLKGNQLTW